MNELKRHEEFEMLVLDQLRKIKVIDQLIFGGGTMLRLCHELPRYSVDFDFYLKKGRESFLPWVDKLSGALHTLGAEITDQHEKHHTFLWEIRMPDYPRRLKIEVRKNADESRMTEIAIAHSQYSSMQVRLTSLTLHQMWLNKINALSDRKEIRDAYDLEFLSLRGTGEFKKIGGETLHKLVAIVAAFKPNDYKVVLGHSLEKEERERVLSSQFSYLKSQMTAVLNLAK